MTQKPEVLNPLYTTAAEIRPNPEGKQTGGDTKMTETAGITNLVPGECPKCHNQMGKGKLGMAMGHQEVDFCPRCRVAEPIANV